MVDILAGLEPIDDVGLPAGWVLSGWRADHGRATSLWVMWSQRRVDPVCRK